MFNFIVDGQWSRWIDTPSSATCGVGCRLRYRECSNPYPQQGGKKCTGSRNKHVNCLQYNPCPGNSFNKSSVKNIVAVKY